MAVFRHEDGVVVQVWRDVAELDELKAKYGIDGDDLATGTAVVGQLFDGKTLTNPVIKSPVTADAIKGHFRDRLTAVVGSVAAQQNISGWMAAPAELLGDQAPTEADRALYAAGIAWVGAMFAVLRRLEADLPEDFTDDHRWPDPPVGLADLANRF